MEPEPRDGSIVPGVPNGALFIAVPVLANFAVVSYDTGYCRALSIPFWYISTSPVQLVIIGLFSLPVGWLLIASVRALSRRSRFVDAWTKGDQAKASSLLAVSAGVSALSCVWGYATAYTTQDWSGVVGAPGCAILTRFGDTVIATDFDPGTHRLRGRLTIYALDKVPTTDVYRVKLDVRSGFARTESVKDEASCPRAK